MELNQEVAYIIGAMRDGSFIHNKKYGINRIRVYQKNRIWIQRLSQLFESSFGKAPTIIKDERDDVWSLMINSVSIFRFLVKISEFNGNQKEWNTPTTIINSSDETKKEFIKGFFDSEGGVPHIEKRDIEPKNIRVHFTQANKRCLEELMEMIQSFDIKTGKVCGPYYKMGYPNPIYRLKIHGISNVAKFHDIIGSIHPEKELRLKIIHSMAQDPCEA